ncbi:Ldh family oxidoreductase [Arthrobacter sp. KK5.5]|uniref:Ldh family oxidoreductase n=1 Tax=Arthrobacter sp. KK5.5 TaxID=3373084 RepID=UPI003EE4D0BB
MSQQTYPTADLIRFASEVLQRVDVPARDADLTATSLVEADVRGVSSHGLLRLSLYVAAIEQGGINPHPRIRMVGDTGSAALLDADGALGQVAMQAAVDYAISNTTDRGLSAVAVQGSSHYGAGAFWTDQLAAEGMVAILTSTTGPIVAPYGGIEKIFGTNPLTIAAPSSDTHPLTADLATSTGAYGKIIAARNEGTPIPEGWAVGPDGEPTTDPNAAMAGALIPFGGHKGSAVSALLEAVSASLGTGTYAHETEDIWSNPASRMNTGHLLIALDTGAFAGRKHTEGRVAQLQERIRSAGAHGAEVLAPGDPEHLRAEGNRHDVALAASTSGLLDALAERLGARAPGRSAAHTA